MLLTVPSTYFDLVPVWIFGRRLRDAASPVVFPPPAFEDLQRSRSNRSFQRNRTTRTFQFCRRYVLYGLAQFGPHSLRSRVSRSASFLIPFLPLSLYRSPDLQRQREKPGSEAGVKNQRKLVGPNGRLRLCARLGGVVNNSCRVDRLVLLLWREKKNVCHSTQVEL